MIHPSNYQLNVAYFHSEGEVRSYKKEFSRVVKLHKLISVWTVLCVIQQQMQRRGQGPTLPMGFADQLLDLQMRLQEQESLELIQILSQLYRIGVDYYLQNDLRKANYLQKKLNSLTVRSLDAHSVTRWQPAREDINRRVREEVQKLNQYENTYISTMVQQSQKSQKRIQECVLADLNRQEESLQTRKLRRIRSGKL